jgi:hypothetical protein
VTGHRVAYVDRQLHHKTRELLAYLNEMINEYEAKGMVVTVRQIYYQLVARNVLPNSKKSYGYLGSVLNTGRLAGYISWTAIEDRNRGLVGFQTFNGPEAAVSWLVKEEYRTDVWWNQEFRPEVWVEKAALEGVIGDICAKLRVNYFACRGYNSQSEQWRAGRRLAGYIGKGQRPIIFHLGDHDPSGLDMTRDNRERLSLFAGTDIQVVRLGLNYDQIEKYNPPPNPAKLSDSRSGAYRRKYGNSSWELDALPPGVIHQLIEDAVLRVRDPVKWTEALTEEAEDKEVLKQMIGGALVEDDDTPGLYGA